MSDWLPGVATRPSSHNGGSMIGGNAYWIWHTFECGYDVSAMDGAKSLIRDGNEVHFVFNPITGDIVQILPASVAARGLRNPAGGVETNRQGRVCIQVEVIARAARPWTSDLTPAGKAGLARLMAFADDHGIPRVFPAGPPPAYPSGSSPRSVAVWTGHGGHYGHSQVPENTHGDPGAIDINLLLSSGKNITEDDLTPEQATKLDAIYQGLFYGSTANGKDYPPLLAIEAETQRRVTTQAAQIGALQATVTALAKGGSLTTDEITQAAQAGAEAALKALGDKLAGA